MCTRLRACVCVPMCPCMCVHERRTEERWAYTLQNTGVNVRMFLHLWVRETIRKMCIRIRACVCLCALVCSGETATQEEVGYQTSCVWVYHVFVFLSRRDIWKHVLIYRNMCVSVCICLCVHVWDRNAQRQRERQAYVSGHVRVRVCVFLHFWARDTCTQLCIWITACLYMCACACVHVWQKHTEPEIKMGICVRAGVCGCWCVFAFVSKRDTWTDVHTNHVCVCLRVYVCVLRARQKDREQATKSSFHHLLSSIDQLELMWLYNSKHLRPYKNTPQCTVCFIILVTFI